MRVTCRASNNTMSRASLLAQLSLLGQGACKNHSTRILDQLRVAIHFHPVIHATTSWYPRALSTKSSAVSSSQYAEARSKEIRKKKKQPYTPPFIVGNEVIMTLTTPRQCRQGVRNERHQHRQHPATQAKRAKKSRSQEPPPPLVNNHSKLNLTSSYFPCAPSAPQGL
jgi:hypothetical protein